MDDPGSDSTSSLTPTVSGDPGGCATSSTSFKQPVPLTKPTRKCTQTYFLLSALTVAQIMLLSLFLLWTVKTCYARYHRVHIVPQQEEKSRSFSQNGFSNHRFRGINQRDQGVLDYRPDESIPSFPIESRNRFKNISTNFTIIGSIESNALDFALNWYESLRRLRLTYDVLLDVRDAATYKLLSKINDMNKPKPFGNTRLHFNKHHINGDDGRSVLAGFDVMLNLLMKGRDVLRIDTQTVWLRDPMPLVWREYADCDAMVSPGEFSESIGSSFIFLRSTPDIVSFMGLWMQEITSGASQFDGTIDIAAAFTRAVNNGPQTLRLCRLDGSKFSSVGSAFLTEDGLSDHGNSIHVVSAGSKDDSRAKRDLFYRKHLWYLRRKSDIKHYLKN